MHPADFAAELRGEVQVVDQVTLVGQRDPVGGLAVALHVEHREGGVQVRGHARRLADDPAGAFFGGVDHGQQFVAPEGFGTGHLAIHLLLHAQRHLFQRQFAQLQQVVLREEVAERRGDLVGAVDLSGFQPFDQLVGREVDVHHLVGHRQHAVRDPLADLDARDLLDDLVQPLDMLDVDGRNDADPCVENLHHVLPPLGVFAPLDVGVGQFVHDDDLGAEVDDGLRVHLLQFLALVEESAARHERKPFDKGFRSGAAVRFDVADADVDARVEQLAGLLQHAAGLAHAGAHADVDLELAAVRTPDQFQKPLNAVLPLHRLHPEGDASHKVNVVQGRIPDQVGENADRHRIRPFDGP